MAFMTVFRKDFWFLAFAFFEFIFERKKLVLVAWGVGTTIIIIITSGLVNIFLLAGLIGTITAEWIVGRLTLLLYNFYYCSTYIYFF